MESTSLPPMSESPPVIASTLDFAFCRGFGTLEFSNSMSSFLDPSGLSRSSVL